MIDELIEAWEPTQADIEAYIHGQGWPTFGSITYDHLESKEERQKLETAVLTVMAFVDEVKAGATPSLIMVANAIDGDMARTGYGCGKTTLARIAHYAVSNIQYIKDLPGQLWVHPAGLMFDARSMMALFDKDHFDQRYEFSRFGRLLVIDDLGREGNLKWEKRDLEIQLQEKRDRYYSIINHCYEAGISLVVTSNLTSREMAEFLGGASWSRLLQMCPARYRVNMTGIMDMRPLLADTDWF